MLIISLWNLGFGNLLCSYWMYNIKMFNFFYRVRLEEWEPQDHLERTERG